MKQTFKTLALITLIGGSLTACGGSNGGGGTLKEPIQLRNGTVYKGDLPATKIEGANIECANYDCTASFGLKKVKGKVVDVGEGIVKGVFAFNGTNIEIYTDGTTYEYVFEGDYDGVLDGKANEAFINYTPNEAYNNTYLRQKAQGIGDYKAQADAAIVSTLKSGYTGKGVNILIQDDFKDTHGPTVSRIIKGIATEANITKRQGYYNGYSYEDESKADIINQSYNFYYTPNEIRNSKLDLTSRSTDDAWGALRIVAADNKAEEGKDCSTLDKCNGVALQQIYQNEEVLVVGALNDEGTALEPYSNPAGLLKDYYIAAPVSDRDPNLSGTSFAAPYVTGVAALIMDKFNTVDPKNVKEIIFTTATDLGAPGTDSVFGRGALNVNAALSPVGRLN